MGQMVEVGRGSNRVNKAIEVSQCVYLASMAVKIEGYLIMIFCNNASLMFIPAEVWGPQPEKNCQNICYCPSTLICIYEKLNNKFHSI